MGMHTDKIWLSTILKKISRAPIGPILLLFFLTPEIHAGAIIIDHNCTNIDLVPDWAISASTPTKAVIRSCSILLNGLYFSSSTGLAYLKTQNSKYNYTNFKITYHWHPGGEKVYDDLPYNEVLTSTDATSATGFVANHFNQYDVFLTYLFHGENWIRGYVDWPYYRDRMLYCETTYPTKKFVWCTASLMKTYTPLSEPWNQYEEYRQIQSFNDNMRAYCRDNGKILYDLADIECHWIDGTKVVSSSGSFELLCSTYTIDTDHPNTL